MLSKIINAWTDSYRVHREPARRAQDGGAPGVERERLERAPPRRTSAARSVVDLVGPISRCPDGSDMWPSAGT